MWRHCNRSRRHPQPKGALGPSASWARTLQMTAPFTKPHTSAVKAGQRGDAVGAERGGHAQPRPSPRLTTSASQASRRSCGGCHHAPRSVDRRHASASVPCGPARRWSSRLRRHPHRSQQMQRINRHHCSRSHHCGRSMTDPFARARGHRRRRRHGVGRWCWHQTMRRIYAPRRRTAFLWRAPGAGMTKTKRESAVNAPVGHWPLQRCVGDWSCL